MIAADFSSRQALADLERAAGGDPLADDTSAAFDRMAPPDRVRATTASLLWQAMAGRREDPFLEDIWDQRQAELLAAPAPIRAALMNGYQRLCDLGLLEATCKPLPDHRVTHSRTDVDAALKTIARAMTLPEMDHISRADYGMDVARHRDALIALLADPEVAYPKGEFWYPAEVVELVAYVPKSTGYIPCMAIVLLDALRTGDMQDKATFRLERQWAELLALPLRARDAFLAAYRHLYETDILGAPNLPKTFTLPWVENIGPASAKSDCRKR